MATLKTRELRMGIRRTLIHHWPPLSSYKEIALCEAEEYARCFPEDFRAAPSGDEALRQWMRVHGESEDWRASLEAWEVFKEEAEHAHLVRTFERLFAYVQALGPQYEAAVSVWATKQKGLGNLSLQEIISIFSLRYTSEARGEKLSLEEIARRLGKEYPEAYAPTVGRVLKSAGWEPAYGVNRRLTKEQKEKLIHAYIKTTYPLSIIALFLGIDSSAAGVSIQRNVSKDVRSSRDSQRYSVQGMHISFSYVTASRVYQAVDLGLEDTVVMEILGVKGHLLNSILRERTVIEQKLIALLSLLFPEKEHDVPYVVHEKDHRPRTLIQMMLNHPTEIPQTKTQIYTKIKQRGIPLSTALFYRCIHEYAFRYPQGFDFVGSKGVHRDFFRDEWIQKGCSLGEMVALDRERRAEDALTKDGFHKYIKRSGQHDLWVAARVQRENYRS